MDKKPQWILLPLGILLAALCGYLCVFQWTVGVIAAVVCAAAILVCLKLLTKYISNQRELMDSVFQENSTAAGHLITDVGIPCFLFDTEGRIVWRNKAFAQIHTGRDVRAILPQFDPNQLASFTFSYNSQFYQAKNLPVTRHKPGRKLTFQYWIDRTEAEHYKNIYEAQMPYVGLIYVDNYEELILDAQFRRNAVLTDVEELVSTLATEFEGLYRRYENGRFLLIFEAKHLETLEKNRFEILERARAINTGTEQPVTLSIAVGVATRIGQADESARQAMELALGRGGDQAVVKNGTNYTFFGGRQQAQTQQSKIRIRLFAKALRQLAENAGEMYIMGHRQPDMDCIGAALGLLSCARAAGCRAYLVLAGSNQSIDVAYEQMRENPALNGFIVSPEYVASAIRPSSILVVVDTQRSASTIAPELLERTQKLVLIDHHRRSADYIDNATLNYLDARASSTSEIVAEIMQYFHENVRPTVFECNALLGGIVVDTKQFAYNVSARTFEAAGYLKRCGASSALVRQLFQDERETYANRVDVVKNAKLLENGIALSTCEQGMRNAELIAAQAADELIMLRGVEASFVLAWAGNGSFINISGRSIGNVNVQLILERLGGGGHLTMAAAQMFNCTMQEAIAALKESIQLYTQEVKS